MKLTAFDAMTVVLDINETSSDLHEQYNSGNMPNPLILRATGLLASYRTLLLDIMEKSVIIGGEENGDKQSEEENSR